MSVFSYIEKSCNNFSNLSEENKFIWSMTSADIDIIVKLANHMFTCFNIRKQSCSSSQYSLVLLLAL